MATTIDDKKSTLGKSITKASQMMMGVGKRLFLQTEYFSLIFLPLYLIRDTIAQATKICYS